jgi:hypothetical protein
MSYSEAEGTRARTVTPAEIRSDDAGGVSDNLRRILSREGNRLNILEQEMADIERRLGAATSDRPGVRPAGDP